MVIKKAIAVVAVTLIYSANLIAVPTDTEYIPSNKYFEVTLNEISQAKTSIKLTMYLVSLSDDEPGSQVYKLLDSLVQAKARGVDVEVILDQTLNFGEEQSEEIGR